MRANRAYRLIVRRGGWLPASIADPGRADHLEIVEIASGEVLLAVAVKFGATRLIDNEVIKL